MRDQHSLEKNSRLGAVRGSKHAPADYREEEHRASLSTLRSAVPDALIATVQNQEQSVVPAPHHEGPLRAVPETAEQHGDHQVPIGPPLAIAAAAERHVKVIAQA